MKVVYPRTGLSLLLPTTGPGFVLFSYVPMMIILLICTSICVVSRQQTAEPFKLDDQATVLANQSSCEANKTHVLALKLATGESLKVSHCSGINVVAMTCQ